MAQHSREVTEMEQMLQEQILQVKEDSQQKVSASVLNLLQHCEKLKFFSDCK